MGNNFFLWDSARCCPPKGLGNLQCWRLAAPLVMTLSSLMQRQVWRCFELQDVQVTSRGPIQLKAFYDFDWSSRFLGCLNQSVMKLVQWHLCFCWRLHHLKPNSWISFFKYMQIYGCTVAKVFWFFFCFPLPLLFIPSFIRVYKHEKISLLTSFRMQTAHFPFQHNEYKQGMCLTKTFT